MQPRITIERLVAQDGSTVNLADAGLTVVVGANNVGKSRLLREILQRIQHPDANTLTLKSAYAIRTPALSQSDRPDLTGLARRTNTPVAFDDSWSPIGLDHIQFHGPGLAFQWSNGGNLDNATRCFVDLVTPLAALATMKHFTRGGQIPEHRILLEQMRHDGRTDAALSELCNQVFGFQLTFDRLASRDQYRIGRPAVAPPPIDNPSPEYAQALSDLDLLEDQGDGVRTFLGCALNALASPAHILLLDEPDAFLHPPQARQLGQWLATTAVSAKKQIVAATHSRDLLVGALDAEVPVRVVRVARSPSGQTHLSELPPENTENLWNDPALRYSNILQGLFHAQTVIAESDSDCRFYRAVLDSIAEGSSQQTQASETLFVPSSGKDHVAPLAAALTALGVRCFAIVDFDVLRVAAKTKKILRSLGGRWTTEIDNWYKILRDWANAEQNWDLLKKNGRGPARGPVRAALDSLLVALGEQRLLVVPVGEMEDLEPSLALEKTPWVREMLKSGRYRSCQPARELVGQLLRPE